MMGDISACVLDCLLETLAEIMLSSSLSLFKQCKEVMQCHLPTGIAWQCRNSWSRPLDCVDYSEIQMLYKKFESTMLAYSVFFG